MNDILTLATAGMRPEQFSGMARLKYPRIDFMELQHYVNDDRLDYTAYERTRLGDFFRRLETQLRSDVYLSLLGLLKERNYRLVFAMSERAGIPLAGLRRMKPGHHPPFVSMFTCWSPRQERLITHLNLFDQMDAIIVHCQSMKHHFTSLGVPEEKIHVITYSVDHHFFSPSNGIEQQNFILTLGETRTRNYQTLFKAIEGLPVQLLAFTSGRWYAREKETHLGTVVPENVTLMECLPLTQLKQHYSQAKFVVLPLYDQVFSAGATVALEAACTGRAIIATRTQGIVDYIIDGETGILVDPGDEKALRFAIEDLLAHPDRARQLGDNARRRVEQELNLDIYVERIAQLLQTFL